MKQKTATQQWGAVNVLDWISPASGSICSCGPSIVSLHRRGKGKKEKELTSCALQTDDVR